MQLQTMKAEHERVKSLLLDTVSLLCKNGLSYNSELQVQGLIGVTIDQKEVFLVHLDEVYKGRGVSVLPQGVLGQHSASLPTHPLLGHPIPPPVFNQNMEKHHVQVKQEFESRVEVAIVEESEKNHQRPVHSDTLPPVYGNAVFPDHNIAKPRSGQTSPNDRSQQDRKRRSWTSKDKPFKCQVKPCRKSYYYLHDLRRHHKQKHWMLPWAVQCRDQETGDDPSKAAQWYEGDDSALDLSLRYSGCPDHGVQSVHKMDELEALEAEYSGGRQLSRAERGELSKDVSESDASITDVENVRSDGDFQMDGDMQDDVIQGHS